MKKLLTGLLVLATALTFAGCGGNPSDGAKTDVNVKLEYHDYKGTTDYNQETVYCNDLKTIGADPSVIYVSEGEQAGYYYMYITSDDIGCSGFLSYRSKNLNNWECMGIAYLPTLYTDDDGITYSSFATSNFWAPECIYDNGLYYLFYNATYLYKADSFYIDCVVSENPNGPFVQYAEYIQTRDDVEQDVKDSWKPVADNVAAGNDGAQLGDGKLRVWQPLLDFSKMSFSDINENGFGGYMKAIDASPFVDPKTGDKYLYFVRDRFGAAINGYWADQSSIYILEMNDDWTPALDEGGHYKTVKKLTEANRDENGAYKELYEGTVNEGPFVMYNATSDKYYLTYSVNSYDTKSYQVRVAIADEPTGPFKKLTVREGGYLLRADDTTWASGTGHNSFVTANGKTFIVYHAHTARINAGNQTRAVAFDEVNWIANSDGLLVPYVNGPTYSFMPQLTGEYTNIAPKATVTSTNVAEGSDIKYLTDGLIKIRSGGLAVNEFTMSGGAAVITLTFDDYKEVRGLFVFNSKDYDTAFGRISKVEFDFTDTQKKVSGTAYTDALDYDWDRYLDDDKLIAGGNFAIEFAPLMVKEIRITLPNITELHAISEIMVLGK